MNLAKLTVAPRDEPRFRALMDGHHYPGAPPKTGHTVWQSADDGSGAWPALAAFPAAALKCDARDTWIGWSRREQFGRLHLIANNTRLLLPGRRPNPGSRFLAPGAWSGTGRPASATNSCCWRRSWIRPASAARFTAPPAGRPSARPGATAATATAMSPDRRRSGSCCCRSTGTPGAFSGHPRWRRTFS